MAQNKSGRDTERIKMLKDGDLDGFLKEQTGEERNLLREWFLVEDEEDAKTLIQWGAETLRQELCEGDGRVGRLQGASCRHAACAYVFDQLDRRGLAYPLLAFDRIKPSRDLGGGDIKDGMRALGKDGRPYFKAVWELLKLPADQFDIVFKEASENLQKDLKLGVLVWSIRYHLIDQFLKYRMRRELDIYIGDQKRRERLKNIAKGIVNGDKMLAQDLVADAYEKTADTIKTGTYIILVEAYLTQSVKNSASGENKKNEKLFAYDDTFGAERESDDEPDKQFAQESATEKLDQYLKNMGERDQSLIKIRLETEHNSQMIDRNIEEIKEDKIKHQDLLEGKNIRPKLDLQTLKMKEIELCQIIKKKVEDLLTHLNLFYQKNKGQKMSKTTQEEIDEINEKNQTLGMLLEQITQADGIQIAELWEGTPYNLKLAWYYYNALAFNGILYPSTNASEAAYKRARGRLKKYAKKRKA